MGWPHLNTLTLGSSLNVVKLKPFSSSYAAASDRNDASGSGLALLRRSRSRLDFTPRLGCCGLEGGMVGVGRGDGAGGMGRGGAGGATGGAIGGAAGGALLLEATTAGGLGVWLIELEDDEEAEIEGGRAERGEGARR